LLRDLGTILIPAARRRGHLQAVAIAILLAGLLSACSAPVSPTITPTVSEPSPTSEKVVLNCNTVLSDSDAAALTPPLHPIPSFASPVIVAIPFATELTAAKAAAASGEAVDVSQVDAAYFETSDGMGQVQIFMGSYWIDCASSAFTGADQAVETCSLVVSNLRGAGG
jgi:hypothetical protein